MDRNVSGSTRTASAPIRASSWRMISPNPFDSEPNVAPEQRRDDNSAATPPMPPAKCAPTIAPAPMISDWMTTTSVLGDPTGDQRPAVDRRHQETVHDPPVDVLDDAMPAQPRRTARSSRSRPASGSRDSWSHVANPGISVTFRNNAPNRSSQITGWTSARRRTTVVEETPAHAAATWTRSGLRRRSSVGLPVARDRTRPVYRDRRRRGRDARRSPRRRRPRASSAASAGDGGRSPVGAGTEHAPIGRRFAEAVDAQHRGD